MPAPRIAQEKLAALLAWLAARCEWLLAALVLTGALRIGWMNRDGARLAQPRIDAQYAGLREAIEARARPGEALGWISREGLDTLEGQRRFGQAAYALAPRILLPDDGSLRLVLAALPEGDAAAWAARGGGPRGGGLEPIARSRGASLWQRR